MSLSRFERALLSSGAEDGPSAERKDAARAAFLRAASASGATGTALTSAGEGAGATSTATTTKLSFAKLLLFAALGIGAAAVTIVATRAAPPAAPSAAIQAGPAAKAEASANPGTPGEPSLPAVSVEVLPAAAPSARPASSSAARPVVDRRPPAEDPLAAEARLLERARRCLSDGDRACARARVAEHAMRFSRGALSDEATVLAIDVAMADGDRTEAQRLAAELLAREPDGPWSSRVRRLADGEIEN